MGLYVYCFVPPTGPPPSSQPGIDGARVQVLEEGDVRVWCSEAASAPTPSLDRVREHHAVVHAAMEAQESLLPMRFGQWFATRERLSERLRGSGVRYGERLEAVAGAREFGVRIRDPEAPSAPVAEEKPSSGREHLEALARREGVRRTLEKRGKKLVEALRERTKDLVRDDRVQTPKPGWGIVSVSHLVDRDRTSAYAEAVRRFEVDHAGLIVHVSGPWPPYSFSEQA